MKFQKLNNIKKLYFGCNDIANVLGVTIESARVSANRYVKQGVLVRIKRNVYMCKETWKVLERGEKFTLANLIQVPSYVSLMTAMGYYEITTQIQQDFIESIAVKRTKEVNVNNCTFTYNKINKDLYFDFSREAGFFIATAEKAFVDAIYLMSLKKYNFDLTSIDFDKLDMGKVRILARKFPRKTQRILEKNGYF